MHKFNKKRKKALEAIDELRRLPEFYDYTPPSKAYKKPASSCMLDKFKNLFPEAFSPESLHNNNQQHTPGTSVQSAQHLASQEAVAHSPLKIICSSPSAALDFSNNLNLDITKTIQVLIQSVSLILEKPFSQITTLHNISSECFQLS
ncbi:hypothetical protein NPIL_601841 [Nephila pilipes]|uniref:Uncharacterized protein n=1 Tax=Nephila pilipes TaxID=299642 RepID=A0A8X6NGI0_NEPPI|nr:hypothetical protein NPIL_601841 [Nephila pilipes]